jgi:acetyltransferase
VSRRNLEGLLRPRSVVVIGASSRGRSIGSIVFKNLIAGRFEGTVWPVNPKHASIAGRRAYRTVEELPEVPELAVICTPAQSVPSIISQLGVKGTRAAIVITAGLESSGPSGKPLQAEMLEAAKPYLLRILGPNCLGLLSPRIGLNASFAHVDALPGSLAFVSQSGALTTAMLDWAKSQRIGFSHFISLGNSSDVDFGDLLDYLSDDPHTRAILLYVESITQARKFMSAARAAARNKPVIVVKAGRVPEGAKAATSHTGALAGSDDIYDAAFRRAGMLRVKTTRQLFEAAESLARMKALSDERLIIVSNGGGPVVMATDALIEGGGKLASLSPRLLAQLDAVLPQNWSHGNPIDIIGDAPAERYAAALNCLLADNAAEADETHPAVLLIHAPTAVVPSSEIAGECLPVLTASSRPVLTCWMGGESVAKAAAICTDAGIPTYATPEEGVDAFLQLVRYRENQRQLMEVPSSHPENFIAKTAEARAIIDAALAERREILMEHEAKGVLAAYGIPIVKTAVAHSLADLGYVSREIGFPCALKILSPDITHKSDVGGVALNIQSLEQLEAVAVAMASRAAERKPNAQLIGFTVQHMVKRDGAIELIAGLTVDPTFGPVVLFGQGGTAVEVIADKAVALAPLNRPLARDLVSRTRAQKLLAGYRHRHAANADAIDLTLVKISQLAVDFPQVVELDINPLLADEEGVIALDARIRVQPPLAGGSQRLAIRPYPQELEEWVEVSGRSLLLRPIRPEDFEKHRAFLAKVSEEDLRTRFFRYVRELRIDELASLTQIDYERAMAFVAIANDAEGRSETLGVVRAYADPDNIEAEFAILVRSDWGGHGLGTVLLEKLIRYCRARGIQRLIGEVLAENTRMLHLARDCGFEIDRAREGVVRVSLDLHSL